MIGTDPVCSTCGERMLATMSAGPKGITPVFFSCSSCDGPFVLALAIAGASPPFVSQDRSTRRQTAAARLENACA